MISSVFSLSLFFLVGQSESGVSKPNVIIDGRQGLRSEAQPFVESGNASISGEPETRVKPAFRTWESACSAWKKELSRLNKRNLLIADCGSPKMKTSKVGSETYHRYESAATYKIRVGSR